MISKFRKIIASLAISGLVLYWTSPALASMEYDPNDPFFDPSGTYVPSAPVVTPDPTINSEPEQEVQSSTDDSGASQNSNLDSSVQPAEELSKEDISLPESNSSSDQNVVAANDQTGSDSENTATVETGTENNTNVENNASIDNNVTAAAESGKNLSDQNTGDGSVESGDSDLVANIINAANSVITGANSFALPIINYFGDLLGDLSPFDGANNNGSIQNNSNLTQVASNSQTGSDSENNSAVSTNENSNTAIDNVGSILNKLFFGSDTGQNSASQNTGDGSITTGDANVASNAVNFLNNTITASNFWMGMINIFGDWTGNLLLPMFAGGGGSTTDTNMTSANQQTGSGSDNLAQNILSGSSDTSISNDANIIDGVNIDANTGQNDASKNTLGGEIETGDINVKNNMLSIANNTITGNDWWMILVNSLSGWTGAIVGAPDGSQTFVPFMFGTSATNTATGADSENEAIVSNAQTETTDIENNGTVDNRITLKANTGKNVASENTGSGSIQTGDANVMSNLVNFVNNTFNVKNWMFGIVNVFGEWDGNALFSGGNSNNVLTASQVEMDASNTQTGANSENDALIDHSNTSELKINNDLYFRSTQNIKANTGENSADKNSGSGSIETGDIDVLSTLGLFGNITELSGSGEAELSADAANSKTGANSENNAIIKFFDKFKVAICNAADVVKKVAMDLNTGKNSADKNTGDGAVITGDIKAEFRDKEVVNVVNITKPVKPPVIKPPVIKPPVINPPEPEKGGGEVISPEVMGFQEILALGEVLPLAGAEILLPVLMALALMFSNRARKFFLKK